MLHVKDVPPSLGPASAAIDIEPITPFGAVHVLVRAADRLLVGRHPAPSAGWGADAHGREEDSRQDGVDRLSCSGGETFVAVM